MLIYLESEWGKNVAEALIVRLNKRIEQLAQQPYTGANSGIKNCRSVLITKHNRLYYRISDNTIEILNIYSTRINPVKNPFYKK
nr:type II toxin-antitoxin system RelE/ParE family toxin [Niabella ginsengisoli]